MTKKKSHFLDKTIFIDETVLLLLSIYTRNHRLYSVFRLKSKIKFTKLRENIAG